MREKEETHLLNSEAMFLYRINFTLHAWRDKLSHVTV